MGAKTSTKRELEERAMQIIARVEKREASEGKLVNDKYCRLVFQPYPFGARKVEVSAADAELARVLCYFTARTIGWHPKRWYEFWRRDVAEEGERNE